VRNGCKNLTEVRIYRLGRWASLLALAPAAAGCFDDAQDESSRADALPRVAPSVCGREVVNDIWADGDLDQSYRSECFAWALKSIPPDALSSQLRGTLRRERAKAQRQELREL
jgi:hypothetical protein